MRHLIIALVVAMSIVPWWWKFPGSNSCSCHCMNSTGAPSKSSPPLESSPLLGAAQSSKSCDDCRVVKARYSCYYYFTTDVGQDVWPILAPRWYGRDAIRNFPVNNAAFGGGDRCPGRDKYLTISVFGEPRIGDPEGVLLWENHAFQGLELVVDYCKCRS